jgi:hypothetical protein
MVHKMGALQGLLNNLQSSKLGNQKATLAIAILWWWNLAIIVTDRNVTSETSGKLLANPHDCN